MNLILRVTWHPEFSEYEFWLNHQVLFPPECEVGFDMIPGDCLVTTRRCLSDVSGIIPVDLSNWEEQQPKTRKGVCLSVSSRRVSVSFAIKKDGDMRFLWTAGS